MGIHSAEAAAGAEDHVRIRYAHVGFESWEIVPRHLAAEALKRAADYAGLDAGSKWRLQQVAIELVTVEELERGLVRDSE